LTVRSPRRRANLSLKQHLEGVGVDHYLELSDRIVLGCRSCGERVVLLGREDDWYSEGRTAFACECGARLTLADRVGEDLAIVELMRGLGTTNGGR
jgi:hypothetical protein